MMLKIIQQYRTQFASLQVNKQVKCREMMDCKFLGILLGLMLFFSCGTSLDQKAEAPVVAEGNIVKMTDAQLLHAQISTVKITEKKISTTLRANGKLILPPQYSVSVSTPMGGYVKSTQLLPGMAVKKGEVIATVADISLIKLQEDYLKTESRLSYLKLDYDRQKQLNEGKASSDKVMQLAQAELRDLQIARAALAQQLKFLNIDPNSLNVDRIKDHILIRSPLDGIVSKVNVNMGKYVSASDMLFELIDPSELLLSLKVYEKDIHAIQMGQALTVHTQQDASKKYLAKVMLIGQDIGADGTAEVLCRLVDKDKKMIMGMFMTADIEVDMHRADVVPELCVVHYEQGDYIFIGIDKHVFEMVKVTVGVRENGYVQLLKADALKERNVVQNNAYTLLMALKNVPEE